MTSDCRNKILQCYDWWKKWFNTYESIRQIATSQGDDYTTGCLLDYNHNKSHYKLIAIDLSKQQELDADPKAIQQINFTENLDRAGQTTMFSSLKKQKKKKHFSFLTRKYKRIVNVFHNFILF